MTIRRVVAAVLGGIAFGVVLGEAILIVRGVAFEFLADR